MLRLREELMHKNNDWGYHVKRRNVDLTQKESGASTHCTRWRSKRLPELSAHGHRPHTHECFVQNSTCVRVTSLSMFLGEWKHMVICKGCEKHKSASHVSPRQLLTQTWRRYRCPYCYVLKSWSFICCQICTPRYDASPTLSSSLTIMWPIMSRPEVAYFTSTDSLVDAYV